jgi:ubiquinone/menaquinone biosynthesis C-methylase UbiE
MSIATTNTSDVQAAEELKQRVAEYWSNKTCQTNFATAQKFSRDYYEQIEDYRAKDEPEIAGFAEFTRYRGKEVLEVGVGAGTDFIQWARSGAKAHGVDLTPEAIEHTTQRLQTYGLTCESLRVADAEHLPFPDESFDLVYSYGVIHHTPDTAKALSEIVRVMRVGGRGKIMLYNKRSSIAWLNWVRHALLKGNPFQSVDKVLFDHMESIGTKAYTRGEVLKMLEPYPLKLWKLDTTVAQRDLMPKQPLPVRIAAHLISIVIGLNYCGWSMKIDFEKTAKFPR